MKKLVMAVLISLLAITANAADRSLHAEWTKYTPPTGAVVSGFNLYKENVLACKFPGAVIVSGDCVTDVSALKTNFTLTALFADGNESPKSNAFVLTDYGPAPQGLKVTVVTITTTFKLSKAGRFYSKNVSIKTSTAEPGQVVKEGSTTPSKNAKGQWEIVTTMVM